MKTKGIITGVSQKEGKYGFTIGKDNWYNGYGQCPCKKGDEIEVEYEVNNNFKIVTEVKILSEQSTEPSGPEIGLKRKLATDCLLKATELCQKEKIDLKSMGSIKEIATQFYKTAMEIANENI